MSGFDIDDLLQRQLPAQIGVVAAMVLLVSPKISPAVIYFALFVIQQLHSAECASLMHQPRNECQLLQVFLFRIRLRVWLLLDGAQRHSVQLVSIQ